jgi:hypothetical protein
MPGHRRRSGSFEAFVRGTSVATPMGMASATATSVAAKVEGTSRKRAVCNTAGDAPSRSRSRGVRSLGHRVVFFVSLLASTVAALHAHAEPATRAAQARLAVMVSVVSTCSIDSSAVLALRCGTPTAAVVQQGAVQSVRSSAVQTGRYRLTTINF